MEVPALITNRADFESFQERIQESDILQWAIAQRPNSDWVCEMATNVTFFLNRIVQHPIGCVGVTLPDYVKNNKAIVGLVKDHNRKSTYIGVIDLTLPPLPEEEYPLPVRSICLNLFRKTSTVFHPSSRKTVEVCVQLTFQNGCHKKHGTDMQRLCCNIIRNLNLVHIIRTYTEHYHYAQTKYTLVRHSMLSKIRILIENTPRSVTMPDGNLGWLEGIGTFAVWGRTIDFSLIGLNVIANGVAKFTHHTVGSFLRNCNCFVTL